MVLDTSNRIVQRQLALPGGVAVSLPISGVATWSYPNVHGDVIAAADAAGARTGKVVTYEFGRDDDEGSRRAKVSPAGVSPVAGAAPAATTSSDEDSIQVPLQDLQVPRVRPSPRRQF